MASSPAMSDDNWPSSARGFDDRPPESGGGDLGDHGILSRPDHDDRVLERPRRARRSRIVRIKVRSPARSRAFGRPIRVDAPAARTMAGVIPGRSYTLDRKQANLLTLV